MFSLKAFVKLLIILLSCISSSISNKLSKRYKIEEQNIDFGDFLLNSPNRGAQLAQLQMLADSKRRKTPIILSPEQIKQQQSQLNSSYQWQSTWPENKKQLGAVSAVSFDTSGNVVVFHRADRIWNAETFDATNVFTQRNKGSISENTIIGFERNSGKIIYEWGKGLFYMPHGLTIDQENNAWITDVALHQVMKFNPNGGINGKPVLTLGQQFKPGNGKINFCKPTSVAVLPDGDFFVADGYCNARIIKFSKTGERILSWGESSFSGPAIDGPAPENYFAVPHALTLAGNGVLCVADRENGRIQCFNTSNGTFIKQFHNQLVGDRLFSVAYSPIKGGQLFVVNGPVGVNDVLGFIFDFQTGKVLSKFGRNGLTFSNPHDIIVTEDGSEIYVAELNPNRVHKLISSDIQISNLSIDLSPVKPTATLDSSILMSSTSIETNKREPGQTALIVTALIVIFALLTFGLALLIARRRKRGCMPFGVRNRRHAWEFPNVKSDGFKLGNLLDRTHGFEKLDQEASDDEPNVTTNMLSNSQFA